MFTRKHKTLKKPIETKPTITAASTLKVFCSKDYGLQLITFRLGYVNVCQSLYRTIEHMTYAKKEKRHEYEQLLKS